MNDFLSSELFSVTLTLLVFRGAQTLYQRYKFAFLNPVLLSVLTLIGFLKGTNISYQQYFAGGQIISFFLAPAVVALGVPLYLHLPEIKKRGKALLISLLVGSVLGIVSAAGIAALLGASQAVICSLAPKSVTTPIAMDIAQRIGGIPPLTAAIVIATGILDINAPANIILPAGLELPISLDITVPVDKEVPVVLTVPVNIPLNQTELHEPFVGLQQVVEPYKVMLGDLPDAWMETPICQGMLDEVCTFMLGSQ